MNPDAVAGWCMVIAAVATIVGVLLVVALGADKP